MEYNGCEKTQIKALAFGKAVSDTVNGKSGFMNVLRIVSPRFGSDKVTTPLWIPDIDKS